MSIQTLMEQKSMTKYRLSKLSDVPYTTLGDICSGKAELKKCSAETVYRLAKALGVTMEELLADSMAERADFELFKSEVCHTVRSLGDAGFIVDTLEKQTIRAYYDRKWYPESLYLLAMLDYISRENGVPLCSEYNDLRRCRLAKPIYPASVLAVCAAAGNDAAKKASLSAAIPEFKRFNIVECEVRNVV